MHTEADIKAKIIRDNAEARLAVAKDKSEAFMKEASSEEKAAGAMEGTRKHDEKMKLAETLKKLSSNGHMVISGKNGEQVLNYFNKTIDDISKR